MADVIDPTLLLAFLTARTAATDPVVAAIYMGLAERVRRGDFNTERSDDALVQDR